MSEATFHWKFSGFVQVEANIIDSVCDQIPQHGKSSGQWFL